MIRKIQLGVLGFGRLGSIHARNIVMSDDAELTAVCDIDMKALRQAEHQYQTKVFSDIENFLSQPLDGVVVASSTHNHLEHLKLIIGACKSVFTEKPVGLTIEETDAVLQQIIDAGIQFQIGFQRRWDPRYLKVKEIIDSGEIGEPILFKAYGRDPDASRPENWGLGKNGGLFLNAAIHDYDAARFLMDREVNKLTATGASLVHKGLDQFADIDTCTTTLFLGDNAMALTEWSRYATYGYDIGLEIVGTEGMVQIGRKQTSSITTLRKNEHAPNVYNVFSDAYRAEINGFIEAIKHGLPMTPGIEDARSALQLALYARKSFEDGNILTSVPPLLPLRKSTT